MPAYSRTEALQHSSTPEQQGLNTSQGIRHQLSPTAPVQTLTLPLQG